MKFDDFRATVRLIGVMSVLSVTAGCSFLPSQGPNSLEVVSPSPADPSRIPYIVVDLTPSVAALMQPSAVDTLYGSFGLQKAPPPTIQLGVGDIVNVTIFEAASGGLFIPSEAGARAGNFVALPAQEVDKNGTITVPYAGQVPAVGKSPAQVAATIVERLKNRAIEPQAVVSLQESRAAQVSVTGEVNTSIRFPLTKSGDRVLDAIARAGGPKYQAFESYVTLQRGNQRARAYLNTIIQNPDENVYLLPGDTIIVARQFRSFMALGASGLNGQINFDNETLTLSQAMGKAGGVLDSRGDPGQIFLYRVEPKSAVAKMGYDVARFVSHVPIIYRLNMRQPDGFFLAERFPVRDKDVLFVSNAQSVELTKLLNVIDLSANTGTDVDALRLAIRAIR